MRSIDILAPQIEGDTTQTITEDKENDFLEKLNKALDEHVNRVDEEEDNTDNSTDEDVED